MCVAAAVIHHVAMYSIKIIIKFYAVMPILNIIVGPVDRCSR